MVGGDAEVLERAKPVLQARLEQLSTYGLLASKGESYVKGLLDALIAEKTAYIITKKYPLVTLTKHEKLIM